MAKTKAEKEMELFELSVMFNDYAMRELGLDIDDGNHIYDADELSILQIDGKFIKYFDDIYDKEYLKSNEIELNLIDNPRLMEYLSIRYIRNKICEPKGVNFVSVSQEVAPGSDKGYFTLAYETSGQIKNKDSDSFVNESLRIFNLICKLNKTEHMYASKMETLDKAFCKRRK